MYLLGLYLGDGHISRMPKTYRLRIFLNKAHPHILHEAARAISTLLPDHRVGFAERGQCVAVTSYWNGWPRLIPQAGPGRKHQRRIALELWQQTVGEAYPGHFVRGCLHSDWCRHRRIVNGKDYPAYSFATTRTTSASSSAGPAG